jgi:hypothetical protein
MVDFERIMNSDAVLRHVKPVCGSCGLGLHIRKVSTIGDQIDYQIEVDQCPVCEKAAEARADWTQPQEEHLQELIDFALNSKAVFFGRPIRNLSPAEVMAALGWMIRESEKAEETFDTLLPPY